MTGDFFLSVLTPLITGVFSFAFFDLWRRRRKHPHLLYIAITYAICTLAFVIQAFAPAAENWVMRFAMNGLFLAAILGLCASALLRLNIGVPFKTFGLVSAVGMSIFFFFLVVEPSFVARIFAINGTFFVLTSMTFALMLCSRPQTRADWLVLVVAGAGGLISILRPILTAFDSGSLVGGAGDVVYWPALHGVTIFMAISVALAFMATTATEVVEELRADAQQDRLSGLLNRTGFDQKVEAALGRQQSRLTPVSLMIADLDDFKVINDTYGHPVGDRVIAEVGRILRDHGGAERAGRVGGEEFALFYSDARRGDVSRHAERLLLELHKLQVPGLPKDNRVTMSVGIYTHLGTVTLSELMIAADAALYDAKRGGKNCVVLAPLKLHNALRDTSVLSTYAASA